MLDDSYWNISIVALISVHPSIFFICEENTLFINLNSSNIYVLFIHYCLLRTLHETSFVLVHSSSDHTCMVLWFSVFDIMHEFHDIYIFPMDVICLANFYVSPPFAYIS